MKNGDKAMIGFVIFLLGSLFAWTEITKGGYYDNTIRKNDLYQNEFKLKN